MSTTPSMSIQADEYIEMNYDEFVKLGVRFFEEFPPVKDQISTQVRNLQQVVTSATRFVEIEDFVKNQMGKGRNASMPWRNLGEAVLKQLNELRAARANVPGLQEDREAPEAEQLPFRLRLARGWVRAVVSEYLYRFASRRMEDAPHG